MWRFGTYLAHKFILLVHQTIQIVVISTISFPSLRPHEFFHISSIDIPYIFRYLPHNHNIKKLFHDIYFAFACFFEECAWLLWHLYDCSITLNMSCNLMKKYTIIGRLNYPHFRRNGITFHFQRFAHNSHIIYNFKR